MAPAATMPSSVTSRIDARMRTRTDTRGRSSCRPLCAVVTRIH
ncbi:hypothetical protein ACFPRL_13080 [Pseudoclavibacter helvolus]